MQVLKIILLFLTIVVVNGSSVYTHRRHSSSVKTQEKDDKIQTSDVFRLPNQIIPISYELRMVPDLENFTFRGEVNIIVRASFTTDRIHLHSKDLVIGNVIVSKLGVRSSSTVENATIYQLDEENDILSIEIGEKFEYDTNYKVSIKFEGVLIDYGYDEDEEALGFYRASYKVGNKTRWLAITTFEPAGARRAFPCFDEPRYRTPFTIFVARSKHHIAISNMPSEKTLPPDSMSGDLIWEKFQTTPPMPAYLVAFMVSDYRAVQSEEDERIRVIARPNGIQRTHYSLKQATRLLKYFEGYFGIPYSLPKLDIVAIPYFVAGMENWGMVVLDDAYVVMKNIESGMHKSEAIGIISHELAHLWFGDFVTIAWYDYLWTKEGFATYFQYFGTAAIEPSWNQDQIFVVEVVQDSLNSQEVRTNSMTRSIRTNKGISSSFDDLSYNKAASVIRMFELMLSPSTFQNALHNYLKDGQRNQNGVTVQKNLFDAFDKQVELDSLSHLPRHISASDIMRTWSENLGYPLIEVTRSYKTGEVTITQMPFQLNKNLEPCLTDTKWIIPLTYTTKSKLEFSNTLPSHWSFGNKPLVLSGINESDWVLFNLKQSGYYRVNYDPTNWGLLIDQLITDHTQIDVLNRAQIIDDAIALSLFGKIEFPTLANLLQYLNNEENIVPWYSASRSLLNMLEISRFNASVEEIMKKNFKVLLSTGIKNIGCNISPSDDHIVKVLKPTFLDFANKLEFKDCIDELLETYRNNYNDLNEIMPDLRPAVLCNAMRYSPEPKSAYEHLWSTYKKSIKSQEKKQIMTSIFSCTKDQGIIKSLLSKIFDQSNEEISKQDGLHILKALIKEVPAVTASIEFIDEKLVPIQSELDDESNTLLEVLQASISSHIVTDEQAKLFQAVKLKLTTET